MTLCWCPDGKNYRLRRAVRAKAAEPAQAISLELRAKQVRRRETMIGVECETCPVTNECLAYEEAREENDLSYHPQNVVRVWYEDCPLVSLIRVLQKDKEAQ